MVVARIFGKLLETQPGFVPWWMEELTLSQRCAILAELAAEVADYVEEGDRPEVVAESLIGMGLIFHPREWVHIPETNWELINDSDTTLWMSIRPVSGTDDRKPDA